MEASAPRIVRRPVKEDDAEHYLLLMLLSFGATVVIVRAYLKLAGFPQVGGGELHIAHLLWGGLLLFIGTLLPLMFANRWVHRVTALVSGVGVGLFIDEVGKFITKNNNYFYPAAAPIIYSIFLVTVLLYLQVRRQRATDARSELYHALDDLTEAIDNDLNQREWAAIETNLQRVSTSVNSPDQAQLAAVLLEFIHSPKLTLVVPQPPFYAPWIAKAREIETRLSTRPLHRALVVIGLSLFGLLALANLLPFLADLTSTSSFEQMTARLIRDGIITSSNGLLWYIVQLLLQAMVGLLLLTAGILLAAGREQQGAGLGAFGLLLYLLTVNLLVLYFDQYATFVITVLQFALLLAVIRYQHRFLNKRDAVLKLSNIFHYESR